MPGDNHTHVLPVVAIVAGILVLLMPRLLNYIVALALFVVYRSFRPERHLQVPALDAVTPARAFFSRATCVRDPVHGCYGGPGAIEP